MTIIQLNKYTRNNINCTQLMKTLACSIQINEMKFNLNKQNFWFDERLNGLK